MSNIKSLSVTLTNAVKVEVVSSCVWTHTTPYTNINTYEGETKFVSAAIAVAKQNSDNIFTTIFVTTKESGDWMHRFDITKHELARLAAYEFVKVLPKMFAVAYGIHADGFARLKSDTRNEESRKMTVAFTMDFNRQMEGGITEFRMESVSDSDPVVEESSTAADVVEDIKPNQFRGLVYKPSSDTTQNS